MSTQRDDGRARPGARPRNGRMADVRPHGAMAGEWLVPMAGVMAGRGEVPVYITESDEMPRCSATLTVAGADPGESGSEGTG